MENNGTVKHLFTLSSADICVFSRVLSKNICY